MSTEATPQIDPVDTAYLAIGAMKAWDDLPTPSPEFEGGQRAFVAEVIEHAQLLANKWQGCSEDFQGVWAYEVAEEFGERAGALLLAGEALDAVELVDELIAAAMG